MTTFDWGRFAERREPDRNARRRREIVEGAAKLRHRELDAELDDQLANDAVKGWRYHRGTLPLWKRADGR